MYCTLASVIYLLVTRVLLSPRFYTCLERAEDEAVRTPSRGRGGQPGASWPERESVCVSVPRRPMLGP
jgi:hypothetical protein